MSDPVGTFSGIASGIQWRDMVDQIMSIETGRQLTPVQDRQKELSAAADAWDKFQGVVSKFRDASTALRLASSFDAFSAVASQSPTTGRDLISASASTGAAPGSYAVEVLATARADKLGGLVVATGSTALGVTGSFAVNGSVISVTATDTLLTLRDKLNAANAGSLASGVSATVLAAPGGSRLVLSADSTGVSGIETVDDGNGTLQALGLSDGTSTSNFDATGAAQSQRFTNATGAVSALIGLTMPPATTIKVGGYTIAVDLSTDSLTTIAAKINAASGNASSARVASSTTNGVTTYRLVTDLTVDADSSGVLADSTRALATLGFTRTGRGDVAQIIASANSFTDASTGLAATAATLMTDLQVNGQSLNVLSGDTLSVGGSRGDGTSVTRSLSIGAGTTVQDLLNSINDSGSGFGSGTRTATAAVAGGRITLADSTAGDSQLGLVLTVAHAGGSTVSLGAFGTGNGGTAGLSRQIVAGADAVLRVDGQLVRRSSNTITDAISGVTLNALIAEPGTTSQLDITRDTGAIAKLIQDFATAYNGIRSFITTNTAAGAALANDSSLRSIASTLTSSLLSNVVGTTGSYTSAAIAGLQHDKTGVLSLDTGVFTAALKTNFNDIRTLFTQTGTTSDSEVSFITASLKTQPSSTPYAVAITQAATQASVTGSVWTTYATAGTDDTMTISDVSSGATGSIALSNGDTIADVTQKLNAMFAAQHMSMQASRTNDDRLVLTSTEYGTAGGFTVAYTPGTADGTAQLGLAAQSYTGLNVAGTINGVAGTGFGQLLTGATGDASEGLSIKYSGTTVRAAGTVSFSVGVAGTLERFAAALSDDTTGSITTQEDTDRTAADALDARLTDIQARLDARRAALIAQFTEMEAAISKSQSIGSWLTGQINALNAN